jgi:hypothetical protein
MLIDKARWVWNVEDAKCTPMGAASNHGPESGASGGDVMLSRCTVDGVELSGNLKSMWAQLE